MYSLITANNKLFLPSQTSRIRNLKSIILRSYYLETTQLPFIKLAKYKALHRLAVKINKAN